MPDNAQASGAECRANRHLFLSRRSPRQKQVRDICTRDGQHKADRTKQDEQRGAYVADEYFAQGRQRRAVSLHTVLLGNALSHRNEFGAGRLNGYTRLQTRNGVDAGVTPPLLHLVGAQSDGHEYVRRCAESVTRGQYTDDRVARAAQVYLVTYQRGV